MITRNYYLVNKETKKVHFMFKVNPNFLEKDDFPRAWLSGRVYRAYPRDAMTLEELYALDYSDEYDIPGFDHPDGEPFEFMVDINYASFKGYKIFRFNEQIQLYDDFGGTDFIEMNAFLATLFKQYIGPEEVIRWTELNIDFDDKYGVNELVMRDFTIETDEHAGIHLHRRLRDDYEWTGFKKHV